MRSYVVFSSMGPDRPGLARQIAEFFTARGINIERSRGCVLGGEFGMVILTRAAPTISRDSSRTWTACARRPALTSTSGRPRRRFTGRSLRPSPTSSLPPPSTVRGSSIRSARPCMAEASTSMISPPMWTTTPVTGANVFQMVCYFSLPPAVKILDLKKRPQPHRR